MKNTLKVLAVITLITGAAAALTGCLSTAITGENHGEFGRNIRTPVKDFASVGLVFTETQLTNSFTASEGQIFTYQALLREAGRLGADSIINVTIDKKTEMMVGGGQKETWYGSALAIKYTNVLSQTVTVGANSTQTTSVYFNEDDGEDTGRKREFKAPKGGIRQ